MKRCRPADHVLDIGTGGGEALLSIAEYASLLIGIDQSASMIETALSNCAIQNKHNVRFILMDANHLDFAENSFQVVSCRHSPFSAQEVAKVLVDGGTFLTQQVSENDKLNLKQAFGRGQAFDSEKGALKEKYRVELLEAGFSEVQTFEFNAMQYYHTAEDLIFLLKHTPIIPYFGQKEEDFQILDKFISQHQTKKGIQTNAERFMIIARK